MILLTFFLIINCKNNNLVTIDNKIKFNEVKEIVPEEVKTFIEVIENGDVDTLKFLSGYQNYKNTIIENLHFFVKCDINEENKKVFDYIDNSISTFNLKNNTNKNFLVLACENNNKPLVEYLLEKNKDINSSDDFKKTPLMAACQSGNLELVKFIVENGADINQKDNKGQAAIFYPFIYDHINIAKYLISKKAKINYNNKDRLNIIDIAAKNKSVNILKYTFDNKTFGTERYHKEEWACLFAIAGMYDEFVNMLEQGVRINAQSPYTKKYLHQCAAEGGNIEILALLKNRKAPFAFSHRGYPYNIMDIAVNNNDRNLVLHIIDNKTFYQMDISLEEELCYLCAIGDIEKIEELLEIEREVNLNYFDKRDRSPMLYAVFNNHLPVVKLLIEKGASLNGGPEDGYSAFVWACKKNHINLAKYLLELEYQQEGYDVNKVNSMNKSDIFYAARTGDDDLVKSLIKKGADIYMLSKDKNYAANEAFAAGFVELAFYLMGNSIKSMEYIFSYTNVNDVKNNKILSLIKDNINNFTDLYKIKKINNITKHIFDLNIDDTADMLKKAAEMGLAGIMETLLNDKFPSNLGINEYEVNILQNGNIIVKQYSVDGENIGLIDIVYKKIIELQNMVLEIENDDDVNEVNKNFKRETINNNIREMQEIHRKLTNDVSAYSYFLDQNRH
jgi:ankyrin repeat protein